MSGLFIFFYFSAEKRESFYGRPLQGDNIPVTMPVAVE